MKFDRFGSAISEIRDRKILENISILTRFYETLNMFSQYYQYEKIDGVIRKKVELIPEKSFREALANALVHRLWGVNINVKMSIFDDRIEISSPGLLLPDISVEEYFKTKISSIRKFNFSYSSSVEYSFKFN